ncbi:MAG: HEAT repeat domain-containing protein, partial [Thermodesulfovibrionales bacterium]|nr:HEAT repeat domain-containing protein [Thermodesulfovibrionales bacterium]
MTQEGVESTVKATGLLGGIASVLNFGGRTLVKTYDVVTDVGSKAIGVIGKTASSVGSGIPKVFEGVKGVFGKIGSGQKGQLKAKIAEYEEKIKKLYYEIGKESSSSQKLESDKVNELIAKVREYEQEIERLNQQIQEMAEIERLKAEEAKKDKEKTVKKKVKVSDEQTINAIKTAIENGLKQGSFDSESQREIFKKIANDLTDDEMEVRILASAELGKMGIPPASDVLIEAVKFDNPYLTAEVINSLTNIGDARVLGICKENVKSANHRCRISSLRGLYKMGANEEIAPYLIEALNDEHPEAVSYTHLRAH